jgi:hypothetical protein
MSRVGFDIMTICARAQNANPGAVLHFIVRIQTYTECNRIRYTTLKIIVAK